MTEYREPTRLGRLVDHRYGKAGVRILRVDRGSEPHRLFEATLEMILEAATAEAYAEGDNRRVLPTDTMKNTVYALAREQTFDTPESFALLLARHFTTSHDPVERAEVHIVEKLWSRHDEHPTAFVAAGREEHTTSVIVEASGAEKITSGIDGLEILKSRDSAFAGFSRDRFTLLRETEDRLLATRLTACWDYSSTAEPDFDRTRQRIRQALLDAFADHRSRSVQHTLYWMAEAALRAAPEVDRVSLRMPNKHCLLAPLEAVGLDNPNLVFVPTDEPAGMIEGTVERR